jgi:hypothetical protein
MRYLLLILTFLGADIALAQEKKTETTVGPIQKEVLTIDDSYPEAFKGQKIQVYDKDGKAQGEFDRTKWRIVPRDKKVVYRQTKTVNSTCDKKCPEASGSPMFKRHTIGLLLGLGKTGLETTAPDNEPLEVSQKNGLVVGAQYIYRWDDEWSFSGLVTTNNSIMAGGHYSFNL